MMEATRRVPRRTRAGYTWIQAHTPVWLYERLQQIAKGERRSMSNLIIVLLIEALRARGERVPDDERGTDDR